MIPKKIDLPKQAVKDYAARNVQSAQSRAVYTPYGYFRSITDCAKYIFENDARMRNHWRGLHPYNTIMNIRNMVSKRCHSDEYSSWQFRD